MNFDLGLLALPRGKAAQRRKERKAKRRRKTQKQPTKTQTSLLRYTTKPPPEEKREAPPPPEKRGPRPSVFGDLLQAATTPAPAAPPPPAADPFVPQRLQDVVGNRKAIQKLVRLLAGFPANMPASKQAILVWGPSGCGKTSAVSLALRHCKYAPVLLEALAGPGSMCGSFEENLAIAARRRPHPLPPAIFLDDFVGSADPRTVKALASVLKPPKQKRKRRVRDGSGTFSPFFRDEPGAVPLSSR